MSEVQQGGRGCLYILKRLGIAADITDVPRVARCNSEAVGKITTTTLLSPSDMMQAEHEALRDVEDTKVI
jgi:hypothetical protein